MCRIETLQPLVNAFCELGHDSEKHLHQKIAVSIELGANECAWVQRACDDSIRTLALIEGFCKEDVAQLTISVRAKSGASLVHDVLHDVVSRLHLLSRGDRSESRY